METKEQHKIIASNIKKYLKENKMTQKELAEAVGVTPSTISDYMNLRSKPSHGVIQRMANHFGVGKSDIDSTYKDMATPNKNILSIYNKLNKTNQTKVYNFAEKTLEEQNSNVIDLREYKDVDILSILSAGTGVVDLDPNHTERISYNGFIPNEYDAAFRVKGDSMEPLFEDGEILFAVKDEEVRNGQVGVVVIDGEAFVKKMYVENDCLRLVSLNKKYEDIIANGSNEIIVYGRVVL